MCFLAAEITSLTYHANRKSVSDDPADLAQALLNSWELLCFAQAELKVRGGVQVTLPTLAGCQDARDSAALHSVTVLL